MRIDVAAKLKKSTFPDAGSYNQLNSFLTTKGKIKSGKFSKVI